MKLNLQKINLKENEINNDVDYLQLLCDLGILDDLEDWPLYQEMERKSDANLTDELCEKYFRFLN